MKKQLLSHLIYCVLFIVGTVLSSCEKIPGHSVVPSGGTSSGATGGTGSTGGTGGTGGGTGGTGGTNGTGAGNTSWGGDGVVPGSGSGPIAVGPTNTVIFRINNDTTYIYGPLSFLIQVLLPLEHL